MKQQLGEVTSNGNLRKAINQAQKDPWVFKGSLDDVGEAVVPHELHSVTLWMPKGVHTVKTEARMHALHRSASFISRQIKQTHISDRQALYIPKSVDAPGFRSTVETPCLACHSTATRVEARDQRRSSQRLELAFRTKSQTMRNSNMPRECNRIQRNTFGTMRTQVFIGKNIDTG